MSTEKRNASSLTAWTALATLMAIASALILYMGRGLNFYRDEWFFVMYRDGHDFVNFVSSYAGHLLFWPTALYAFLFHAVGLNDYGLYRVVALPWFLACALLVYLLTRRRIGDVAALAPAGLLLFLGSGWMDILWPMQVVYTGALVFGLGAILALERGDLLDDALACLALTVSIGWSALALPFLVAVAVGLFVRGRLWRRIWMLVVPIGAYLWWLLAYGEQEIDYADLGEVPHYLLKVAGTGVAGIGGLPASVGPYLLAVLVVPIAIRLRAVGRSSPLAWEALAWVVSFWVLTAVARIQYHDPTATRYIYPSAIFLLLLAVGLAPRGVPSGRAVAAALVLAALCLPLNIAALNRGSNYLKANARMVSAELGALQLARNRVAPEYSPPLDGFPRTVLASFFFGATERYGSSPADTPAEIAASPDPDRRGADAISIAALQVRLGAVPRAARRQRNCLAARGPGIEVTGSVPGAGISVEALGSPLRVGLRRFGSGYQWLPALVPAGSRRLLRIATDAERRRPWRVRLAANRGPVRVCGIRRGGAQGLSATANTRFEQGPLEDSSSRSRRGSKRASA